MKATSIKQIKFNRGQVSSLLSERVDMGLQNACGTVYDNIYINRYGQIQHSPSLLFNASVPYGDSIICLFDTGTDKIFVITLSSNNKINVYGPLSIEHPYQSVDFSHVLASATLSNPSDLGYKAYQFGYNVVFYGNNKKPWLLTLTPVFTDWSALNLTVKENYFDNSFDNIYVRGTNIETPTGFTVPTSGEYRINDQKSITTQMFVTVDRNGAGGDFTQDLVGQVLQCGANGGALQVRSVESANSLTAYVLSPLVIINANDSHINIPFSNNQSEWVFGYERAYGATAGPTGIPSYPDSVIYVNQRLIFGGNIYHGSLISVSRIGVINDFDPETATESDAFTTSIASKDFCRIVAFTVSNNELRIACTNGEFAMPLANLTPSGSLNGFDLRSEVGVSLDSAICDCGGVTVYASGDKNSLYGTQFSLLRDRYQPISLTSQTSNIVKDCKQLCFLRDRTNNESNILIGLNSDGTLFGGSIDINAGLIGFVKMLNTRRQISAANQFDFYLSQLFPVRNALWAVFYERNISQGELFLARFSMDEMFDFPSFYYSPNNPMNGLLPTYTGVRIPRLIARLILANPTNASKYRALYKNPQTDEYEIITPTGYTNNNDDTYTVNFADNIVQSNIVCAGFVRQSDWRSVEIGIGMATRELNKQIVKLESVIEPLQVTSGGRFAGLTLTPEQARKFIQLTRSKDVEAIDVDNLSSDSYTESADLVWRRAFDNPSREMYYGVSSVMPFLVKSITATVQFDEIS